LRARGLREIPSIGIQAVGDAVRFKQSVAVDRGEQRALEQRRIDGAWRIGGEFATDCFHVGVDPVGNFDHVVGKSPDVGAVRLAHDARHPQRGKPRHQGVMSCIEARHRKS
jgi:hypothetical protein